MDPNDNLKEQLDLARECVQGEPCYANADVIRLAELVLALDEWLKSGGFLPRRWQPPRKERTMMRITFEQWTRDVDQHVWALAGCSLHDLPDVCYADWYEDGYTPRQAARKAIRNARDE